MCLCRLYGLSKQHMIGRLRLFHQSIRMIPHEFTPIKSGTLCLICEYKMKKIIVLGIYYITIIISIFLIVLLIF